MHEKDWIPDNSQHHFSVSKKNVALLNLIGAIMEGPPKGSQSFMHLGQALDWVDMYRAPLMRFHTGPASLDVSSMGREMINIALRELDQIEDRYRKALQNKLNEQKGASI